MINRITTNIFISHAPILVRIGKITTLKRVSSQSRYVSEVFSPTLIFYVSCPMHFIEIQTHYFGKSLSTKKFIHSEICISIVANMTLILLQGFFKRNQNGRYALENALISQVYFNFAQIKQKLGRCAWDMGHGWIVYYFTRYSYFGNYECTQLAILECPLGFLEFSICTQIFPGILCYVCYVFTKSYFYTTR